MQWGGDQGVLREDIEQVVVREGIEYRVRKSSGLGVVRGGISQGVVCEGRK